MRQAVVAPLSDGPARIADGCEAAPLVKKYEAGVIYEPMDGRSAAEGIRRVAEMPLEERKRVRGNAVELAKRFDREKLARFVEDTLDALVKDEPLPKVDW